MISKFKFFAIFVAIGVLFASCNKDEANQKEHNGAFVETGNVETKIFDFKEKLSTPVKSDDYISTDSAVWYVEAVLNYTYAHHDLEYQFFIDDSIAFECELAGEGLISEANMMLFYETALDSIRNTYRNISHVGKELYLVDAYVDTITDCSVIFGADYRIGITNTAKTLVEDFETPGYDNSDGSPWGWYWGLEQGYCKVGTNYERGDFDGDAATAIDAKVTAEYNRRHMFGMRILTDIVAKSLRGQSEWISNPNDDVPGDQYCDYIVFLVKTDDPGFHTCLDVTEMNYYLFSYLNLDGHVKASWHNPQIPYDYTTVGIDVQPRMDFGSCGAPEGKKMYLVHGLTYSYAKVWEPELIIGIQKYPLI